MSRLKRAWDCWMNLDMGAWTKYVPEKLLWILFGQSLGVFALIMFGCSWIYFDLRHPLGFHGTSEPSAWWRVMEGCWYAGWGVALSIGWILVSKVMFRRQDRPDQPGSGEKPCSI